MQEISSIQNNQDICGLEKNDSIPPTSPYIMRDIATYARDSFNTNLEQVIHFYWLIFSIVVSETEGIQLLLENIQPPKFPN